MLGRPSRWYRPAARSSAPRESEPSSGPAPSSRAATDLVSAGTGYRAGGFDGTSIFTQAETLPFESETVIAYETGLAALRDGLRRAGLRVETDRRNEKINYKVREHSLAKVPHLLVVGKREAEEGTVAVRTLGAEHQKVMPLSEAIAMLKGEGTPPDLKPEN